MARPLLNLLLPTLLSLACAAAPAADPADRRPPTRPIRALLVTGGCCHDYPVQKDLTAKGLEERANIEVFVVHQGGSASDSKIPLYEKPNWSDGFDVVLHDECFAGVNDAAWVERVLKPHREGLPAVVIHCAMHCYRTGDDRWFEFCGVTSRRHGAAYPHEVRNVAPVHPVMRGFGPAWANPAGELYWIEKVWPAATPLASAKNQENGKDEVCVWASEYGEKKTRVFGTTLGHHNETVRADEYLDLLTRGTLWACGKLDDPRYLKEKKPKTVPVNLAKGKPATASSEEAGKGNFAGHAVDGNDGTRWCASGADYPQWWQVDLGGPRHVIGVNLAWESSDGGYLYSISGSPDGETWTPAVTNARAEGEKADSLDLNDARYVRVECLGAKPGAWASLREVEIYGDATVTVDPAADRARADAAKLNDVKVPDGFGLTLFAAPPAVNYPVFVAAAPDGTLYVSSDKNGSLDREKHRGCVYRLRDIDGDGRADESKLFVADVDSPRGLVWDRDRLYLMHPPHLSAYIDRDGDGVADGEQVLVKDVAFGFKDRPADHSSNGVTLGVDGWLYLAIGDFGFLQAKGADGRTLRLRGGGVVRVRPDGTGLELYSRGTRNILEVGLDPLLSGFARDNTNDGGGWDVRLHHFTGLEEHGYPSLFKNFADEAVAPLADYGGGSGCGACFIDEPGLPQGYSPALYTADWGRDRIYRHVMTPAGATFAADQTEFAAIPRVTDLDVDANGAIYASSWKGATFTYAGEDVGYVVRITPTGHKSEPLLDLAKATPKELVELIKSPSHRRRLAAQRELVSRNFYPLDGGAISMTLEKLALSRKESLPTRVASLFALKQALGTDANVFPWRMAKDKALRPFAIRALADREDRLGTIESEDPLLGFKPIDTILAGLKEDAPRTRLEAVVAVGRVGKAKYAESLVPLLADSDPVVAHTAVKSLIRLGSAEPLFAALDRTGATPAVRTGALRILQVLYQPQVVEGLTTRLTTESDPARKRELFAALARLHSREGEWKGNSWGTRPDTTGPLYQPEPWDGTPRVAAALAESFAAAPPGEAAALAAELNRNRIRLDGTLERLIDLAEKDPAALPALVGQLTRGDDLPDRAVPLLVRAATASDAPAEVRSRAAVALLRSDRPEAFTAVLAALAALGDRRGDGESQGLWNAFRNSDSLAKHSESLVDAASHNDAPIGLWADAGLMILSARTGSPEARAAAGQSLAAGWNDERRKARLLEAARLADFRAAEPEVLAALSDPDPAVAAAAKEVAEAWKLRPDDRPSGPLIKSLALDAAYEAVLTAKKQDAALGERVFAKANCAKCHTVRPDEPPRGPYLPAVAKTYRRDRLAEAILRPSKSLAQGFVTQVILLADGRTRVGFVTDESAESVTLRDANGEAAVIPKSEIEERAEQTTSVMPEGLANDLTTGELSALLDYLESLKERK